MAKKSESTTQLINNRAPINWVALLVLVAVVIGLGAFVVVRSFAASGTLSLTTQSTSASLGSTFTVTIHENSGTDAVNAVQSDITYPAGLLRLESVDATTSAFSIEAVNQGDATAGTLSLVRGTTGSVVGDQTVAVLTFTAIGTGSAPVAFANTSALLRASDNTNILTTKTGTTFTVTDTSAPTVPTGVVSTGSTVTSVSLGWTAATDNVAVTGYKVFRNGTQVGSASGTSFTDTGLTPGTSYSYQVAAYDATGNTSAKSVAANLSTAPDTSAPSVPAAPTTASRTMTSITLAWAASTDNVAVTGYKVFRAGVQVGTSATTSYADTGLAPGTTYNYTISSYDAANNNSAKSAVGALATLADTAAPSTPTALTAPAPTNGDVSLSWTASTDNVAVTGYKVFRAGVQVGTSAVTSFVDAGRPSGSYVYTVAANDAAGNTSAQSAPITVTIYARADINHDGHTNVTDLSLMLSNWGRSGTSDVNGDGTVNITDLSILLSGWTG